MEKIQIGVVLKPQGILGQLKISNLTDGAEAIKDLSTVYIGGVEYKILQKSASAAAIFLSLKGVADRNAAELLRGKEVFCDREELSLPKDRFFIADVLGCELYLSSGKRLGVVVDVTCTNVDIFTVETAEGVCDFPFLKKLNAEVDVENKKIVVDAKTFTEVCSYR